MENKIYNFSTMDAVEHGIDAAIILHNMRYWLDYARAHGEHEHDGHYWMYAKASKMQTVFPFWTANKIQKTLKKLEERGVIISGSFNSSAWDRTKWYTMPEFSTQPKRNHRVSQMADCSFSESADSPYGKHINKNNGRFTPPTEEQVFEYMQERDFAHRKESEAFVNFYESKGWLVGKSKMKDWKAAVRNWISRSNLPKTIQHNPQQQQYDHEAARQREIEEIRKGFM